MFQASVAPRIMPTTPVLPTSTTPRSRMSATKRGQDHLGGAQHGPHLGPELAQAAAVLRQVPGVVNARRDLVGEQRAAGQQEELGRPRPRAPLLTCSTQALTPSAYAS